MNGSLISPVCLFCGRNASQINLGFANLLAQPGIWACSDHWRTDGWQNWPHVQAPFDLGYPNNPQAQPPLNEELREDGGIELREDYGIERREG